MTDFLVQEIFRLWDKPNSQKYEDKTCHFYKTTDQTEGFLFPEDNDCCATDDDFLVLNMERNKSYALNSIRNNNREISALVCTFHRLIEISEDSSYDNTETINKIINRIRECDNNILESLINLRMLWFNVLRASVKIYKYEDTNVALKFYNVWNKKVLEKDYFKKFIPSFSNEEYVYKREEIKKAQIRLVREILRDDIGIPARDKEEVLQDLRNSFIENNFTLKSTFSIEHEAFLMDARVAEGIKVFTEEVEIKPFKNTLVLVTLRSSLINEINNFLKKVLLDDSVEL